MWLIVTKSFVWWYSWNLISPTVPPPASPTTAAVDPMVNMHFMSSQASWCHHTTSHLNVWLQPPACATVPTLRLWPMPMVSHLVNHPVQVCHIATNPMWAHLIIRLLSFLALPSLRMWASMPCHIISSTMPVAYNNDSGMHTLTDCKAGVSTIG